MHSNPDPEVRRDQLPSRATQVLEQYGARHAPGHHEHRHARPGRDRSRPRAYAPAPTMTSLPALAILRRARWRRFGAALALAALLLQGFGVALGMHAQAAAWDDAAAICHSSGDSGDDSTSGAGGDGPLHHEFACPLCLALHQLGAVLPPGHAAALPPPLPASDRPAPLAQSQAIGGRLDRPHLPRGPPLFG
jgi:hypothetical protein